MPVGMTPDPTRSQTRIGGRRGPDEQTHRLALAILSSFFAARFVFALSLGPAIDESYTLAISRRLSLSYFDHPPLHQWIAHFAALVAAGSVAALPPFFAPSSPT